MFDYEVFHPRQNVEGDHHRIFESRRCIHNELMQKNYSLSGIQRPLCVPLNIAMTE